MNIWHDISSSRVTSKKIETVDIINKCVENYKKEFENKEE